MHKTMRSLLILFLIASSAFLVGCGSTVPVIKPFKLDIQQGNVVTSKMLLQLRPGMTKSQVRFIMGTPLIVDSFHSNRWDYFYQMRQAGKVIEQRRVILDFENELLSRVRGDVVPQGTPGADTGAVTLSTESSAPARAAPKEGLLENLKFWKSREPEAVKPEPGAEKVQPQSTNDAKPAAEPKAESVDPEKAALPIVAPAEAAVSEPDSTIETSASESTGSEAEPPSMLAVPIEIAPIETQAEQPQPAQIQPETTAPLPAAPVIVDAPDAAPVSKEPAPEPADSKPQPAQPKQDERFIFRMDKQLNTKSLENTQTPQTDSAEAAKPMADADKPQEKSEPEEEYGYFERILEKIGF